VPCAIGPDGWIGAIELTEYLADGIDRRRPGRRAGRGRARNVAAGAAVLVAAAGLAMTGAAPAPAQAAPRAAQPITSAWQIVKQVHDGSFDTVIAVGRNGGWAFDDNPAGDGTAPAAWRRSGRAWTKVPFPGKSNEIVVAAGATSPGNVWAFTSDLSSHSRALRWNGRAWTVQRTFPGQIGGGVVISPSDVWVFGQPFFPSAGFGAWHYNGRTWTHVASGHGLEGGSAVSGNDVWAFEGTDVAHWNGSTWSRTSVARLLPAKQQLNNPEVTGVYAQSRNSVYAIGNGDAQDEGGPTVILHWDGDQWSRVAEGSYGFGVQPVQQVSSDGHGGLWLPMPGVDGQKSYLLHFSGGHLTPVAIPGGPDRTTLYSVALIPGTTGALAGGKTHAFANLGANVGAVLLQYGF
jgi:hypothetical protein